MAVVGGSFEFAKDSGRGWDCHPVQVFCQLPCWAHLHLDFFHGPPKKKRRVGEEELAEEDGDLEEVGVPEKEKPEKANKRRAKLDRKRCLALKCRSGNSQCTLLSVPGQQYCGNHLHKQPHGTVQPEQPEHGEKETEKEKEELEQLVAHATSHPAFDLLTGEHDVDMLLTNHLEPSLHNLKILALP